MFIRIVLIMSLLCGLSGQVVYVAIQDTTQVTVQDTISAEELFLREISDRALAKEEKRKVVTNRILTVLVVILLVDKFVK